jgi:hypothetical protein
MLTVLFCLAQALLPYLTSLSDEMELQSSIFALALYAFIVCRLLLESRPRFARHASSY